MSGGRPEKNTCREDRERAKTIFHTVLVISVGIEVLTGSMLWLFLLLMLGGVVPKLVVREQEVASITMDRLRAEADLVASSRTLELSTNSPSCTVP